ncbi:hypothetical protein BBP40_007557 [Aspergillus hancockii]|nr:hypothetical protein BBP40_007557 [Aspergillus hancockii]
MLTSSGSRRHVHHGAELGQRYQNARNDTTSSFNTITESDEQSPQSASYYARASIYDGLPQPTSESTSPYPPQRDHYPIGPLKGVPKTFSDASYTTDLQEACFIRYFAENLAHWRKPPNAIQFDATDQDRHFALTVPGRAMFCPVLRYALFTASAGHMRQTRKLRNNINGAVTFNGIPLPGLAKTPQFATTTSASPTSSKSLPQSSAIHSPDPKRHLLLRSPPNPRSPHEANIHSSPAISLRHSACLIALRQEIWSAFLHQRPVRLPISPRNDYNKFDTMCDFIWANRILVWWGDSLNFTFGDNHNHNHNHDLNHGDGNSDSDGGVYPTHKSRAQKWTSLRAFETAWATQRPPSFRPIYYLPPSPPKGRYFPVIWHMNDSQVVAEQHMELARILLAVSDPGIQRLGAGAGAVNRGLEAELRAITRRVIGLGMSNRAGPPALVTSAVGISICGEYFEDVGEQEAVVRFLEELEVEHAWPTSGIVGGLTRAWG